MGDEKGERGDEREREKVKGGVRENNRECQARQAADEVGRRLIVVRGGGVWRTGLHCSVFLRLMAGLSIFICGCLEIFDPWQAFVRFSWLHRRTKCTMNGSTLGIPSKMILIHPNDFIRPG